MPPISDQLHTEWKYQVEHCALPISLSRLRQLGQRGRELTGCTTRQRQRHYNEIGQVIMTEYIYYFKMPRKQSTT